MKSNLISYARPTMMTEKRIQELVISINEEIVL